MPQKQNKNNRRAVRRRINLRRRRNSSERLERRELLAGDFWPQLALQPQPENELVADTDTQWAEESLLINNENEAIFANEDNGLDLDTHEQCVVEFEGEPTVAFGDEPAIFGPHSTLRGRTLVINASSWGAAATVSEGIDEQCGTAIYRVSLTSGWFQTEATYPVSQVDDIEFNGSDHADSFRNGTGLPARAMGQGGDDFLWGGNGADELHGGRGEDIIIGGDGNDTLRGGDDNDHIEAGVGSDAVYGDAGNDLLIGGSEDDYVMGNDGNDTLVGSTGNDILMGNDGDDSFNGGDGDDIMAGGNGADTMRGYAGNDYINGGDEDDRMYGGLGDDSLFGGRGDDSLFGEANVDYLIGGPGADILAGGAANDHLEGGDDNDVMDGGTGSDKMWGNDGNDSIEGGPDAGNDELHGGNGNDDLWGDAGEDKLYGDAGNDRLEGDADNDQLDGGEGDDTINGGSGSDFVQGGSGNDVIDGEDGDDRLFGNTGDDRILGSYGDDEIRGGSGDDTLYAHSGDDKVWGGSGDDVLRGGNGNDELRGESGDDALYGNDGGDLLYGGADADQLDGGSGNDGLYGGFGVDRLTGGPGGDRFLVHHNEPGTNKTDSVSDKSSIDAQMNFKDHAGEATVRPQNMKQDAVFAGGAWSQSEIEVIDKALAVMHNDTQSTKLLKKSNGWEVDYYRHGKHLRGSNVAAWNDWAGNVHFPDASFTNVDWTYQIVFHELGHNWDTQGENSTVNDFRKLSGWTEEDKSKDSNYLKGSNQKKDWYYLKNGANFSREYAKSDPLEDFAVAFAAYFMKKGNFSWSGYTNGLTTVPKKMAYMNTFVHQP